MRQRRQEMGKEPSSALSGRAVTASTARVLPVPLTAPAPDPIGLKKLQLATKSPVGALQKRTTMGLGDYSHCRQRMSRGLYGVSGRAALWSPVFHPVHRMPCGTWRIGIEVPEHVRASSPVLEHLRRQLERAFQRAAARGRARRAREAVAAVAAAAAAAREERSRTRMECALARLRAELVSAGCAAGFALWSP